MNLTGLNGGVGACFLYNCASLTTLRLDLSRAPSIGYMFCEGCRSLASVTLTGLNGTIGSKFLKGCSALTTLCLDLSLFAI